MDCGLTDNSMDYVIANAMQLGGVDKEVMLEFLIDMYKIRYKVLVNLPLVAELEPKVEKLADIWAHEKLADSENLIAVLISNSN